MKFAGNDSIFRIMRQSAQRAFRRISAPVQMVYRRILHIVSPASIVGKVSEDIREEVKDVGKKPESIGEYFLVGRRYIAKKIVYLAVLLLITGAALFILVGLPWIRAKFFTQTFIINSEKMQGYTGKVKLLDNKENRTVLFAGRMEEGRINGRGTLYGYDGNKMYEGEFLMEMYEGNGESFYSSGQTCYKGEFAANQYEGRGTLYYPNGKMQYEGEFAGNQFEGKGRLYDEDGNLVYKGSFEGGKKSGEGILYAGGEEIYNGTFKEDEIVEGKVVLFDKKGRVKYESD